MYTFLSAFQIVFLGQIPRSRITGSKNTDFCSSWILLQTAFLSSSPNLHAHHPHTPLAVCEAPLCMHAGSPVWCIFKPTPWEGTPASVCSPEPGEGFNSSESPLWPQEGSVGFYFPCPLPCVWLQGLSSGGLRGLCEPLVPSKAMISGRQGMGKGSVCDSVVIFFLALLSNLSDSRYFFFFKVSPLCVWEDFAA